MRTKKVKTTNLISETLLIVLSTLALTGGCDSPTDSQLMDGLTGDTVVPIMEGEGSNGDDTADGNGGGPEDPAREQPSRDMPPGVVFRNGYGLVVPTDDSEASFLRISTIPRGVGAPLFPEDVDCQEDYFVDLDTEAYVIESWDLPSNVEYDVSLRSLETGDQITIDMAVCETSSGHNFIRSASPFRLIAFTEDKGGDDRQRLLVEACDVVEAVILRNGVPVKRCQIRVNRPASEDGPYAVRTVPIRLTDARFDAPSEIDAGAIIASLNEFWASAAIKFSLSGTKSLGLSSADDLRNTLIITSPSGSPAVSASATAGGAVTIAIGSKYVQVEIATGSSPAAALQQIKEAVQSQAPGTAVEWTGVVNETTSGPWLVVFNSGDLSTVVTISDSGNSLLGDYNLSEFRLTPPPLVPLLTSVMPYADMFVLLANSIDETNTTVDVIISGFDTIRNAKGKTLIGLSYHTMGDVAATGLSSKYENTSMVSHFYSDDADRAWLLPHELGHILQKNGCHVDSADNSCAGDFVFPKENLMREGSSNPGIYIEEVQHARIREILNHELLNPESDKNLIVEACSLQDDIEQDGCRKHRIPKFGRGGNFVWVDCNETYYECPGELVLEEVCAGFGLACRIEWSCYIEVCPETYPCFGRYYP